METQADARAKESAAHWRAMSASRLLDCGMLFGDVLALQSATDAGHGWVEAAEALAQVHAERARGEIANGHLTSAGLSLRAAVAAYQFAQMPLGDDDRKRALYQRVADTLRELCALPEARIARVEVPFDGRCMIGWTVRPAGPARGAVIVFGGQSGWGSCYLRIADALAARGIATVLAEGPGQGETRLLHGMHLDVDVAAAFSRFVDVATKLAPDGGLGIWGNSVGGLFAALTAAADERIDACCVNGAFAAPRLLDFRVFREQAAAMLGTDDPAAIQANFDRLRFDPDRHRIAGSLFVVHGGADPLVSLDDQLPFLEGASPDLRTLQVWDDGDHTIYNHGEERNALVGDWFADRFAAKSA